MKTYLIFLFCGIVALQASSQNLPKVCAGKLNRIENFKSKYVSPRNVDIWLPEGYSPNKKHVVLYMHDGQMLFDSTTTWNHLSWDVDDVASQLLKAKKLNDFIVVGVWSTATRYNDYFPQKPFESLTKAQVDTLRVRHKQNISAEFKVYSDNYLKFLVNELKPYVDAHYATKADQPHTFIAGSSMGGLISMYAICEYPSIFGGAACMSTHWTGVFSLESNPVPQAFFNYMKGHLPSPKNHKIYFDYGDQTLDALYPSLQKQADRILQAKGFTSQSWCTRYFPGENHSETAWHKRLEIPLLFLLKK